MPNWNEIHYRRAADLVQLLETALDPAPAAAPVSPAPPTAPAAPPPRPVVTAAPAPKPVAPTTAAVFKNIPWKK